MTDQELKDLIASLAIDTKEMKREIKESQKKTDEQFRKTEEQMKETDRKLEKIGLLVGSITNNLGDTTENFFYNTINANPTIKGITYDFVDKNLKRHKNGIQDEFDLVLVNGKEVAVIEVKYKAHSNDIIKIKTEKAKNFETLYPEYRDYNHRYGIATFYVNDEIVKVAKEEDVMIIQRKGDLIEVI